jgi:hypothetical protein
MIARCPNCGSYSTTKRRVEVVPRKGSRLIRYGLLLALLAISMLFLGAFVSIVKGVVPHSPVDATYSYGAAFALLVAIGFVTALVWILRQPRRAVVKCSRCGYEGPA